MPAFLTALIPILDRVLGAVIPDPAAKAKAISDLLEAFSKLDLGQLQVNQVEAQNASVFVSGWRPFIGWVCGSALAYQYVVGPIACWIAAIAGYNMPMPPSLNEILWELIFGMLGMGALRSFDKFKGIAR